MVEKTIKAPAKKAASTAAKPAPAKKTPAPKPVAEKPVAVRMTSPATHVNAEVRYHMIAEAAYYRAERNHFESDHLRDWIEAEKEIDAWLKN